MSAQQYDVIVVGGGFAGVASARDLTDNGYNVLLLEARDRLGGRTWAREFEGTDTTIELGGQWFTPEYNKMVQAEIERYDSPIDHSPEQKTVVTLAAGKRYEAPLPTETKSLMGLERAWNHFLNSASRIRPDLPYDIQPIADLDVSWRDFLAPLELSDSMHEYLESWFSLLTGRRPEEGSALNVLTEFLEMDLSVFAYATILDTRFKSTKTLIEAMAADSSAEIRYDSPVTRIHQTDNGVSVSTTQGETAHARYVVVAMPVSCWNDVVYTPALSDVKATVSGERHAAPTVKVWALVQDAPELFSAMGNPEMAGGINTVQTEYVLEEGQIMANFSHDSAVSSHDAGQIEKSLQAYMPGSKVVRIDSHDWYADEYAKGGVISWKPGTLTKHLSELRRPEGRVYFAGADIAMPFNGWIDGAIRTGRESAWRIGQLLATVQD